MAGRMEMVKEILSRNVHCHFLAGWLCRHRKICYRNGGHFPLIPGVCLPCLEKE